MGRDVYIYSSIQRLTYDEGEIRQLFAILDQFSERSIPAGELSIAFLDEETIRIMHGDFLADPTPTDVITFPGDPSDNFAGEICISVEYAAEYAAAHHGIFAEEMALYLVHGWLHLSGLDDRTPEDATRMRREEDHALQLLRGQNAMPVFEFS
jgi:probable rRNA maturation factor